MGQAPHATARSDLPHRLFLLSPASCTGKRAQLLFNDGARSELACAVRTHQGAPVGEVFSFLSGLYFRGKLRYAMTFARPPAGLPGALVITPADGLCPPDACVTLDVLKRYAGVAVDAAEARYTRPLLRDARALAAALAGHDCEVVLLGSIASRKYVELLDGVFGASLRFPADFVGRGDMSRGGLLLRCAADRRELTYVPLAGTKRRGSRPPRLAPRPTRDVPR